MKTGIYTITNKLNGKIYVGFSLDIYDRFSSHKKCLREKRHGNIYLQRTFNLYGIDVLEFEILEECPAEYLASQENYWANMLKSHNRKYGYNMRPTHPEGRTIITDETKRKISDSNKAFFISPEKRREMIDKSKATRILTRYKMPQEVKDKISNSTKGNKKSEQVRQNMSRAQKGRTVTKEAVEKMLTTRTKRGIIGENRTHKGRTGMKHTEESKEKMSKSRFKNKLLQINPDTNEVLKVWDSISDAQKRLGDIPSMYYMCNGKSLYRGYLWIKEKIVKV